MLFWALLASGQINMRKVDGWQTLATKLIDQTIDLAARNGTFMLPGFAPRRIRTKRRAASKQHPRTDRRSLRASHSETVTSRRGNKFCDWYQNGC
jgi:hypothetical protein